MMNSLHSARQMLLEGGYTCVICHAQKVYCSHKRGVRPLLEWYRQGVDFVGGSAADKVVGKATACLYLLLRVRAVYAGVISRPALTALTVAGVEVSYGSLVENIINRTGDGICPFEAAVLGIDDLAQAYLAIQSKAAELGM